MTDKRMSVLEKTKRYFLNRKKIKKSKSSLAMILRVI